MVAEIRTALVAVHIFLAIVWVGGVLFIGWGVYPAMKHLPVGRRREVFRALLAWVHTPFTAAGTGVILTGVLLGTTLGPIRGWSDLGTAYGRIWLTALIIAVVTVVWGSTVGYRLSMGIFRDDSLWSQAEQGDDRPLKRAMGRIAAVESAEVAGFAALIVCMVLLG
ncbi:hypothetical protein [Kyrpidia spormannii]|uniref:Uncharacterized protein n=2 Tax=Kyrpidia spormannii TaxID=2055160 RepID=A0ACA8Z9A3_9BACL|nr:hypothetical protein [Kyrpidia spormannii]CAB3391406.1 conserved membrane protein of unknown function [Kyrpidia spormannii]CAB3392319.1 conserved membrane protein of unknown function [Kyrpidia spormannii]